jgi:hypothetical protein
MDEQTTRTPGPGLPPQVRNVAGAVFLWTLAAWLAQILACYHGLWSYCDFSHALTIAGLVALGFLGQLAYIYREKAIRRASRGMWARRTGYQVGVVFGRVVKFAVDGEWPDPQAAGGAIVGTQRFERRGWWVTVPIAGGTEVWVDRWALWQWLIKVEALRGQLPPGESEIGRSYWEPRIGRPMWMAYMQILEATGAAETVTPDPRSRRYVGGDPWGWVEAYEALRGSEAR